MTEPNQHVKPINHNQSLIILQLTKSLVMVSIGYDFGPTPTHAHPYLERQSTISYVLSWAIFNYILSIWPIWDFKKQMQPIHK